MAGSSQGLLRGWFEKLFGPPNRSAGAKSATTPAGPSAQLSPPQLRRGANFHENPQPWGCTTKDENVLGGEILVPVGQGGTSGGFREWKATQSRTRTRTTTRTMFREQQDSAHPLAPGRLPQKVSIQSFFVLLAL